MQGRIGDKLLEIGGVTREQLDQALHQQRAMGGFLGKILLDMGAVGEDILAPIIAEQLDLPYIDLTSAKINPVAARLYPAAKAREKTCFPCRLVDGKLWVAMVDPLDIDALEDLAFITGCEVVPVVAQESQINEAIEKFCVDDRQSDPDKLMDDVDRALQLSESKCETISILSNKGGTGKTHLAVNLSIQLVKLGKRVLLVDADMGNADISHKLNIYPEVTLLDMLDQDDLPRGIITSTKFGFDLVAGRTGEFRLANIQRAQRAKLIKHFVSMAEPYDFMILDLGAGIATAVIDFGLSADNMIILTTPADVVSGYACAKVALLRHAALQRKFLEQNPGAQVERVFSPWVVVNRLGYPDQGTTTFERIDVTARNHLNPRIEGYSMEARYLGGVPFDAKSIREAEAGNTPVSVLHPGCKPSLIYAEIAAKLANPAVERPAGVAWKGLARLARILRLTPATLVC